MAPAPYWVFLVALIAAGIAARLASSRLPVSSLAHRLGPAEAALAVSALLLLGFHCGAMFFTAEVASVPGLSRPAGAVDDLGRASQLVYWLPALALLLSLRRAWRPALGALAAALAAVGVTMFWSFGLTAHLAALATAVAATVALAAGFVGAPLVPRRG